MISGEAAYSSPANIERVEPQNIVENLYQTANGAHPDGRYLDPEATVWESAADGPAPVSIAPEGVRVQVWDDTALATYVLRATYPSPADRCYRVTDVFRRPSAAAGWRLVHHHAELLDGQVHPHGGDRLAYGSYLRLDELLACQAPLTDAHDELLFVIIHQVYELWFKQILHETALLRRRLDDGQSAGALHTARRIAKILKTIVGQLDVLETMTPRQFASFRPELGSASGFQSNQFRELEAVLGRRDFSRAADDERLMAAISHRSVFDSLLRYLVTQGFAVPSDALARDPREPWRPHPGVRAALAEVYADETTPAMEICEALVDVDEGVQEWRYRHVKMVERIIGARHGTGGSAGAGYLRTTLFRPAFPDLWEVRGLAGPEQGHGGRVTAASSTTSRPRDSSVRGSSQDHAHSAPRFFLAAC